MDCSRMILCPFKELCGTSIYYNCPLRKDAWHSDNANFERTKVELDKNSNVFGKTMLRMEVNK